MAGLWTALLLPVLGGSARATLALPEAWYLGGRADGALCAGNRYCPLLLREQRVENKIPPDCAPTQEPKAEKTEVDESP
jgi:hypothetical protein